jgi:hypothetical protein
MIFDVSGIATRSGLAFKLLEKDFQSDPPSPAAPVQSTQSMLLFDLAQMPRVAIALDYVDRLEIFSIDRVEQRGRQDAIVYGDQIMKILWLSDYLDNAGEHCAADYDTINVIVHYHQGQPIGLVVKRIHDIIEIGSEVVLVLPPQKGIIGSAIHGDQVVSILNLEEVLRLSEVQRTEASTKPGSLSLNSGLSLEGAFA